MKIRIDGLVDFMREIACQYKLYGVKMGSFNLQLIPKRSKDVSGIEDRVLSMYAKGIF